MTQVDHKSQEPQGFTGIRANSSLLLLIMLILSTLACTQLAHNQNALSSAAEKEFRTGIAPDNLNTYLELDFVAASAEEENSEIVRLMIMNRSEKEIVFPANYGVRIFGLAKDGESWLEIQNTVEYQGHGEILEPRKDETSNWVTVVAVRPDPSRSNGLSIFRFVVEGQLVEGESSLSQSVGAYATLHIK